MGRKYQLDLEVNSKSVIFDEKLGDFNKKDNFDFKMFDFR